MNLYVIEPKHDMFIKQVKRVDLNMIQIRLPSIHELFINKLVVSVLQVMLDFATFTHSEPNFNVTRLNLNPCYARNFFA